MNISTKYKVQSTKYEEFNRPNSTVGIAEGGEGRRYFCSFLCCAKKGSRKALKTRNYFSAISAFSAREDLGVAFLSSCLSGLPL